MAENPRAYPDPDRQDEHDEERAPGDADVATSHAPDAPEGDATAETERRASWNTTIDDLIPDPRDEPYHKDDAAERDPYDAGTEVDIHVPPATGRGADEVDDFSTEEELDVDNAPAGHNPEHGTARVRVHEADDVDTAHKEASWIELEGTSPEESTEDAADAGDVEHIPPPDPGKTTCPVCGQATDALRFCGFCGNPLTEQRREIVGDTPVQRAVDRAGSVLEPVAGWTRPGAIRAILAAGFLLILISLLANSPAAALIFGASILPVAILYWCRKIDVFENEPWYIVAGFGIVGVVIGALLGWLGAFTAMSSWFEQGVLNFGAAGFGGRFAEAAGTAPFIVWMIAGVLVPTLALATIVASPLLARRFAPLGNEVMDGLTVAAAMGAGFAIGTAAVFVAPMFDQQGPPISSSAWTLTTIGLTIVRPMVWTMAGGMIGAGAWRYLFSGKLTTALPPVGLGVAGPLLLSLLSLQLATIGLWAEILVGILIAAVMAMLYRRTLAEAVVEDRRVLGSDNARVVCPNCRKITPAGQFCAHCGEEIAGVAEPA